MSFRTLRFTAEPALNAACSCVQPQRDSDPQPLFKISPHIVLVSTGQLANIRSLRLSAVNGRSPGLREMPVPTRPLQEHGNSW